MATDTTIVPNLLVQGNITYAGTISPAIARTSLALDSLQPVPIQIHEWRVWDAYATTSPGTSASDDLGVYGTALGAIPYLGTSDLKSAGATTRYARVIKQVPFEYQATEALQIRFSAGMKTAVADTSCTLNVDVRLAARDGTESATLYAGAAVTMNSLTASEKSFTVTAATLTPGCLLDIRVAIVCTDAAGGSAVIAALYACELMCAVRG